MPRDTRTFDERRQAMAEAAGTLLRTEGPGAVTHRRVATAAGIPVGSANHIYRTQSELYLAAVEFAEEERYRTAAEVVAGLPDRIDDSRETARLLITAWYSPPAPEFLVERRIEPMLLASMDPLTRPAMLRGMARITPLLQTILARAGLGSTAVSDLLPSLTLGAITFAATTETDDAMSLAVDTLARLIEALRKVPGASER
ncbi:hypothetical protein G3H63_13890 [Microbacterium resistens]|uniref:TetR/AcrR family transcriptional regulator n=1 Tax=Microbacterium resistens TaxID=156977 RepID=UPI001C57E01D|nr:hypothetical protein [Microbacterium resistens]MBW1640155.1 hypothetical protein [Microbacterium resistens]